MREMNYVNPKSFDLKWWMLYWRYRKYCFWSRKEDEFKKREGWTM